MGGVKCIVDHWPRNIGVRRWLDERKILGILRVRNAFIYTIFIVLYIQRYWYKCELNKPTRDIHIIGRIEALSGGAALSKIRINGRKTRTADWESDSENEPEASRVKTRASVKTEIKTESDQLQIRNKPTPSNYANLNPAQKLNLLAAK